MYSVHRCLSPALVFTYKPIGISYEEVMGLDVSGDGGGSSLCKSISGAKSSGGRGIFQLLRNQFIVHIVCT